MHAGSNSQKSKYDGMQSLGNTPPIVTKRPKESFFSHTQTGFPPSSLSQPFALFSQLYALSSLSQPLTFFFLSCQSSSPCTTSQPTRHCSAF